MADTIVFTPIPTAEIPTPSAVTFTPVNNMSVLWHVAQRNVEQVVIPRADLAYIRDMGRTFEPLVVIGTDTFITQSGALAQLRKIESMLGASCTITSAQFGSFTDAICTDNGDAQIMACQSPGFFINYQLTFLMQAS